MIDAAGSAPSFTSADQDGFVGSNSADRSTAIIGPALSGKSTFLFALQQACLLGGPDPYDLKFTPRGDKVGRVLKIVGDYVFRGLPIPATSAIDRFEFTIRVKKEGEPEYECAMSMVDGKGATLFPSGSISGQQDEHWTEMVEDARRVRNLVICVDATRPRLETLYVDLPPLIEALSSPDGKLPHDRVLLLFTKFDRVLATFSRGVTGPILGAPPVDMDTLARLVTPVGHARVQLGTALAMIKNAIRGPESAAPARMAVGICSAHGWRKIAIGSLETPEEQLRTWQPFGVREALLFLTTDEPARHPVEDLPLDRAERARASYREFTVRPT
jgi:hypothetical protein